MALAVLWSVFVWIKSLLPESQHPAASQPTPYGINRYILMLIYVFHVILTACDYLGWGPISAMLFRSGAFLWQCTPEEQHQSDPGDGFACIEQNSSVQGLFSCCYAAHFISTAAAGFLIDFAGPKVTALLGGAMSLSSWVILGACSETFRALFPAFILMGTGAGMAYLPMLSIVNLFPGSFGFSLTIMGAGASLSLVTPSILNLINKSGMSFQWVCWSYAICGPLVSLVILSLFLPLDGFIEVDLFVLVRTMQSPRSSAIGISDQQQVTQSATDRQISHLNWGPSAQSRPQVQDTAALSTVTDNDYFQPFRKEACTFLYAGICVYFTICSLAVVYYQKFAPFFLVQEAFEALEIASPFSTIPCIILGRIIILQAQSGISLGELLPRKGIAFPYVCVGAYNRSDYYNVVNIMMFLNMSGVISFILANFNNYTASMLSVCFFSVYIAVFTSQVFMYTKAFFTSVHFGKLVGIACMSGGILSLTIEIVYNRLTLQHVDNCSPALWSIVAILVASYFLLVPMARAGKHKQMVLNDQKVLQSHKTMVKAPIPVVP